MKPTNTYYFGNGTANVYRPELTEEERKRRMDLIKMAAAELLKGRTEQ